MKENWVKTDEGWVNVKNVIFIDIYETPFGDEMEFQFKGKIYTSKIIVGSRPG